MNASNCLASACRVCRYFTPEGRRGGHCQQLGVPVRGSWKACSLAMPPFAPCWERLEGMMGWHPEVLRVRDAMLLERSLNCEQNTVPEPVNASIPH